MSGAGVFNHATRFPSKLAAVVPVRNAGYGSTAAEALALVQADLPIWGSHGLLDSTIFYTASSAWFTHLEHPTGGTSSVPEGRTAMHFSAAPAA
ncbi:hypothetical protein BHS09_34145 [Myxococcus xanthus]|uniref:Uncharacterized protein n=1 Tax=Myxococcus xanthus TaxID=34 RepID=A0AAE6G648_MYXXA|nr:hypothetical protein [Myxococcus xanthus]QDE71628.1 hypothetical protein BHS09_34145 [Myxococcus xanthus]QDE78909.1 hypothetical protein BHS08_34170 [Myxococcus xanthus]